jgi:hypothetical protein
MVQASNLSLKFCLHDENPLIDKEKFTSYEAHTFEFTRSGVTLNGPESGVFFEALSIRSCDLIVHSQSWAQDYRDANLR